MNDNDFLNGNYTAAPHGAAGGDDWHGAPLLYSVPVLPRPSLDILDTGVDTQPLELNSA